jgi:hypothetical protein
MKTKDNAINFNLITLEGLKAPLSSHNHNVKRFTIPSPAIRVFRISNVTATDLKLSLKQ